MWNNEKFKERRIVHKHYGFEYFIIGCDKSSVTAEKAQRRPNQKSFAKTLDMYPIKNLEDLYDKEGYRDGEFKRVIRGRGLLDLK